MLKIWGPVLNSAYYLGFGVWYAEHSWGLIPIVDYVVMVIFSMILGLVWWLAIVLKRIEIEGDSLHISGLIRTITVPTSEIADLKDRTRFESMPSTIVLRSDSRFGRNIRFFPAKPTQTTIAYLRHAN